MKTYIQPSTTLQIVKISTVICESSFMPSGAPGDTNGRPTHA